MVSKMFVGSTGIGSPRVAWVRLTSSVPLRKKSFACVFVVLSVFVVSIIT